MRSADIVPGRYYRVRLTGSPRETDLVRATGIKRNYFGTGNAMTAQRFLARGVIETSHAMRDVLAEETPSPAFFRVIAVIEGETSGE